MTERIIQMDWMCRFCKNRNPGLAGEGKGMSCWNCGHAMDVEEWLMPEETEKAPTITDPKLLELALAKENWNCKTCHTSNRDRDTECSQCGRARNEEVYSDAPTTAVAQTIEQPKKQDVSIQQPRKLPPPDLSPAPVVMEPEPEKQVETRKQVDRGRNVFWVGGVLSAVVVLAVIIAWLAKPFHTVATVQDTSWLYTETLLHREVSHQSGWGRPMVGEIQHLACELRNTGATENCHPHDCRCRTDQVDCHCTAGREERVSPHKVKKPCNCKPDRTYDCRCVKQKEVCTPTKTGAARCNTPPDKCDRCTDKGTCETCESTEYDIKYIPGTCQKCPKQVCETCYDQCPVRREWCEYDLIEWKPRRTEKTSGKDHQTKWFGLQAQGTDERVDRHEAYEVILVGEGHRFEEHPSTLPAFQRFSRGEKYHVEYTRIGTHTILDRAK